LVRAEHAPSGQGGQQRAIPAPVAGKFAVAPLPTIDVAAGEFAHPTDAVTGTR